MNVDAAELPGLVEQLQRQRSLVSKQDIQAMARAFGQVTQGPRHLPPTAIRNGDDAAAIAHQGGHLLIAAEGMWPPFVQREPWFAGFCSLMVNISDIAAMGGRPLAVVDVLFCDRPSDKDDNDDSATEADRQRLLAGMQHASEVFGVPIVGGHISCRPGDTALAVAIVGHANALITSFDARPGQRVLAAIDLRGHFRGTSGNFDAATGAPSGQLRAQLDILPQLAEAGLVRAGKDISMAGIPGTLLMLLEGSGCGAVLDLQRLPAPDHVTALRWLTSFPSFGYLLAVDDKNADDVMARFASVGVTCAAVGEFIAEPVLDLCVTDQRQRYWDLRQQALTGFVAPATIR